MRSSTSSSKRSLVYVIGVLALIGVALVGLEVAVRSMPKAYCKAELNEILGCAHFHTIKRSLGDTGTKRIYLGDSHVEFMVEYQGFRDYTIPALVPSEMLTIMKHLVETRDMEYVLLNLAAHHLQDKANTRGFPVLAEGTLVKQKLPFPVFLNETSLTPGLKKYLWNSLFGRPLPKIKGQQLVSDEDELQLIEDNKARQLEKAKVAPRDNIRWWEENPTVIRNSPWFDSPQTLRDKRTRNRFDFFYPHIAYKTFDEHEAMVELLELFKSNPQINVCVMRFPHSEEYEALIASPNRVRYARAQEYIENKLQRYGIKFVDTADLNLGLTKRDFRDSDHLRRQVIEAMTPALVNACFPEFKTASEKS